MTPTKRRCYRHSLVNWSQRLTERCESTSSLLCVGLDPRVGKASRDPASEILFQNKRIIEATADLAAAFKPNIAFYERLGPPGLVALEKTIAAIPDEIPIILDAKRADVGSTSEAYAEAYFERLNVDAVTLHPYLGREALEPFLGRSGKGVFLLCRTTNPGAGLFQDLQLSESGGEPLYLHLARECASWGEDVGLVVAGNDIETLRLVRQAAPDSWFLAPGVGAQGGDAETAVEAGVRDDGFGLLINVSRGISGADDPRTAAEELRRTIEKGRKSAIRRVAVPGRDLRGNEVTPRPLETEIHKGLVSSGAFKLGEFKLKSGITSPFYIDMRIVPSHPSVFKIVAAAYAELLDGLPFDSIAGIPTAGLPLAAAAAMKTERPMIYPRMQEKQHGTGNRVEGAWKPGDRVVMLDDLITTGGAKIEAAETLRDAGIVVSDLVVLVERGIDGRKQLEEAGIDLHAYTTVEALFAYLEKAGIVDKARYNELLAFVRGDI